MGNGASIAVNPLDSLDTLALVKRLIKAGVPDNQAEVFVEIQKEQFTSIRATLATKEELKKEIELLRNEFQKDLRETELRLKNDLTIRLGIMMAAGISIVATLVKLL